MRGEIISVDGLSGDGLISGDDGLRYRFVAAASRTAVRVGDKVDFIGTGEVATEIMNLGGGTAPAHDATPSYAYEPVNRGFDFGRAMFSFNGRLSRAHYWICWAILFGGYWIWSFIPFLNLLLVFVLPVLLWCNLAVGVKRFHDMGRSGWLIVIPYVATMVGWVYMITVFARAAIADPTAFENPDPAMIGGLLAPMFVVLGLTWLVGIGFWLWMGIADSQPGTNAHGRNPNATGAETADTFR